MNEYDLYRSFDSVDDDILERSEKVQSKRRRPWLKWGALAAACLCVTAAVCLPRLRHPVPEQPTVQTPDDTAEPGVGPSSLTVNGNSYIISSYLAVSTELPEGFTQAGTADVGGYEDRPYYTNPDVPEWVYVYQEVRADGTVDATGTLNRTEPHDAYVRFVDERLRGKDLVCHDGEYYISLWSAHSYGEHPDVTSEYYEAMKNAYDLRIEGSAPEGFVSVGTAVFTGHDTIPREALSSNQGADEIYANPDVPEVLLVSTRWSSASGQHTGFNVYIRYDCPFAE